jgi:hypothetical protein
VWISSKCARTRMKTIIMMMQWWVSLGKYAPLVRLRLGGRAALFWQYVLNSGVACNGSAQEWVGTSTWNAKTRLY